MSDEKQPAPKSSPKNTRVILRGNSHNASDGDERKVSAEDAAFLVENKLARRP